MAKPRAGSRPPPPVNTAVRPLPPEALRWRCDPETLPFRSTAELTPIAGVVGQDSAVEALRFGLETNAPGQNIFVRGLSGTGRMTLLKRMLEETQVRCLLARDRAYVHNFAQPDRPRLITLPRGRAGEFRRRVDRLADFIRDDLMATLTSDALKVRRAALDRTLEQELERTMKPFTEALRAAGLALVTFPAGPVMQTALFPLVDGKPTPPEEFEQLHARGEVSEEHYTALRASYSQFEQQLVEVNEQVMTLRRKHDQAVRELLEKSARAILSDSVRDIERDFAEPAVQTFLGEVIEDVVKNRLARGEEEEDFTRLYRVNVVLEHGDDAKCPLVIENVPTMRNLLGVIEYEFPPGDEPRANHLGIRAGSLLRADGGYLILEVRDVLSEPGAWKALVRTLRTGRLEIVPPEAGLPWWAGPALKPQAVDVHVKVVLLGSADIYYLLDAYDPDFPQLFKVLADFDTTIPRDASGVDEYGRVLARIAVDENLKAFDRTAVAALVEHGARIAARRGKLTTRFGRLADIAREAVFVAEKQSHADVTGDDVREAVRRSKRRADLPARRFRELVADGTIRVQTQGRVVGQINGVAVLQAGPLVYGFPARITATIGPGTAGVINIDREAALSGAIHTKGFYILGGLLRWLLRTDHPLAFNASVAFEQSYGAIDGDSASGAEICCLLSALTDVPLRQDLAMTGAIDQMGHVLAVGGVNEKIEGFFDACRDTGLTGTQGVIIPQGNAGDLMLRDDVVAACRNGQFSVYAVETVHQALELLTGLPAGTPAESGRYADGTLLALAVRRAYEYWLKAAQFHGPSGAPAAGSGALPGESAAARSTSSGT